MGPAQAHLNDVARRAALWDDMAATKRDYAAVAHAIREFEPVTMAVRPQDYVQARAMLDADIAVMEAAIDDSRARDAGPVFVTHPDGSRAAATFRFNAWGGKYLPFDADAAFGGLAAGRAGVRQFTSQLIAEGGGISVDGEGTVITTDTCFPNKNRNPDWSKPAIEAELKEMLGANKVIWLPGNPLEDVTDGHTDGIAIFVAPGVVLMESPADLSTEWNRYLQANIDAMEGQTDANGRRIRIVTMLPMVWPLVIVQATTDVGFVILSASGLSFLGLGAQSPTPEWGVMIFDSLTH